jgi:hypothetical protein
MGRKQRAQYLIYIVLAVVAILLYLRLQGAVEGFEEGEEETLHNDPTVPMKVFMYADKMKPTAKALTASLRKHKYSYEVLGLGKPWEGWVARTKAYLAAIQAYKAKKGPSAVALYIDAYDVICIMDSDKFFQNYTERERDMPVIFGAEQNCNTDMCNKKILDWYDKHTDEGKEGMNRHINTWGTIGEHLWSQVPTFTNNGMIMGTAEGLEFLFSEILKTGIKDDQVAAGNVIVANLDKFDIDFEENLFRNRFRHLEKRDDENGIDGPGFLHFNDMRTEGQQQELIGIYARYNVEL